MILFSNSNLIKPVYLESRQQQKFCDKNQGRLMFYAFCMWPAAKVLSKEVSEPRTLKTPGPVELKFSHSIGPGKPNELNEY